MHATPHFGTRGFTVVEMMVVLVIVATLGVFATPTISGVIVAQRLRSAGSDLVSALYVARSEAIKRNVNVTVRPVTGIDWTTGWIAAAEGGEQVDRRGVTGLRVQVTRAPDTIVYTPSGRLDPIGAVRVEFSDSYGQPGVAPRCVTVDTSGLPRVEARTCA
ncbi:MAG TPA: GspH/FimT family pseudopilin [Casimicrobiaceae bacterium]|nr:GspH/FimT family pseudopilin [Casimicrobiaceae bacterium]